MKKNSYSTRDSILHVRKGYSKIFTKWFMLLLVVVFAAGCKKVLEEPGSIGVCPIVVSTDPADAATGVSLSKTINAVFNEAMKPSTINTTTFTLKAGTTAIQGVITYTGITATFSPTGILTPNTKYTGTITTGAKDPAGSAMIADYVWSFTTGAAPDITPPIIISTDPVDAQAGVLPDKKIAATFNEAMNPLTINDVTFVLKQGVTAVAGIVTYSGTTAVFPPSSNLTTNTTYTATITTAAKD